NLEKMKRLVDHIESKSLDDEDNAFYRKPFNETVREVDKSRFGNNELDGFMSKQNGDVRMKYDAAEKLIRGEYQKNLEAREETKKLADVQIEENFTRLQDGRNMY